MSSKPGDLIQVPNPDDVLSPDQRVRVVLAQKARGILTNTTLISSSGPTAKEVVRLAEWLEGAGRDVYTYKEKGLPEDLPTTFGPGRDIDLDRPYDELSDREKAGLKRLVEAMEKLPPTSGVLGVGHLADAHCPYDPPEGDHPADDEQVAEQYASGECPAGLTPLQRAVAETDARLDPPQEYRLICDRRSGVPGSPTEAYCDQAEGHHLGGADGSGHFFVSLVSDKPSWHITSAQLAERERIRAARLAHFGRAV